VRKLDSNGKFTNWSLSSVKQARVSLPVRPGTKGRRA